MVRVLSLLGLLLFMPSAHALEIPPLVVGAGGGITTAYLNPSLGQVNMSTVQVEAAAGSKQLSVEARVGSSIGGGGDKLRAGQSALTVQFDYFYSLMLKSGLELFDPMNTLFFQGGWSKFRMRLTSGGVDTLSNRASFGYGIGLRRELGSQFGVSAEYMRYSADLRAATLNVDFSL
ncbi:MAG: outer membrane beta-barrel protein [Mariprofundales bacterium]|nr:outer membrane beta-barrel protein [Mariprofundales bacterium]